MNQKKPPIGANRTRKSPSGQTSISEEINQSTRLSPVQKAILAEILQYHVVYGCCRLTDAQLAEKHGGARETQNRRLGRLEKMGLIRREKTQIHYTKRTRRIWIRWAQLWKFLGVRCKDRLRSVRPKGKRHIDTPSGRGKEKDVNSLSTEAVHSDFKEAFYGIGSRVIRNIKQICRMAYAQGTGREQILKFATEEITKNGGSRYQVHEFSEWAMYTLNKVGNRG